MAIGLTETGELVFDGVSETGAFVDEASGVSETGLFVILEGQTQSLTGALTSGGIVAMGVAKAFTGTI